MTLLTLKTAGERLGVHPRTVRSWIERGALPGREVSPGRYRVPEEAVARLLAADDKPTTAGLRVRDEVPR